MTMTNVPAKVVLLLYNLHSLSISIIIDKVHCVQGYIRFGSHLKILLDFTSGSIQSRTKKTCVEAILTQSSVWKGF